MPENFVRLLEAAGRRVSGKRALVWESGSLTWPELDRRASGVARALTAKSVSPGDMITLRIGNGWQFVAAFLGGLKIGATIVPLDALLKESEQADIVRDVQPRAMVQASAERPAEHDVVAVDEVGGQAADRPAVERVAAPALILYTSGSTGRPKGAVLSHDALTFAVRSWAYDVMALTERDVVLSPLPLAHSFGLNGALLAPLLAGSTVVLMERFSPEAALDAIERHGVTVFPGVPTMFRRVLESPAFAPSRLASLRYAISGAAPCEWSLVQEWRAHTGRRILRGYGMTELFRPISHRANDPTDVPDAMGRPVSGVEVVIRDDSGAPLAPGNVGELWIKSPAAMDCYLHAEEETREILVDGWFNTGDLGSVTPDGFVRIAGRKRERILRGGYSIFPREVETVLLSHPAVAEAAVVGVPHPELGEDVAAFVTLRSGCDEQPQELVAYCRQRLAAFKYPRQITIVTELPRSATGKVLKSRLG